MLTNAPYTGPRRRTGDNLQVRGCAAPRLAVLVLGYAALRGKGPRGGTPLRQGSMGVEDRGGPMVRMRREPSVCRRVGTAAESTGLYVIQPPGQLEGLMRVGAVMG